MDAPDWAWNLSDRDRAATWLEAPINREWVAAFRLIPSDDGYTVGEVRVFPGTVPRGPERGRPFGEWEAASLPEDQLGDHVPFGGVNARRVLRRIPLSRVPQALRTLREFYGNLAEWKPDLWKGVYEDIIAVWPALAPHVASIAPPTTKQLRGRSDYFHAWVAALQIEQEGDNQATADFITSHHPDVAQIHGTDGAVRKEHVRSWVETARVRKLATRPGKGNRYSSLTDKGVKALEAGEEEEEQHG